MVDDENEDTTITHKVRGQCIQTLPDVLRNMQILN